MQTWDASQQHGGGVNLAAQNQTKRATTKTQMAKVVPTTSSATPALNSNTNSLSTSSRTTSNAAIASSNSGQKANSQVPRLEISLPSPSLQLWNIPGIAENDSTTQTGNHVKKSNKNNIASMSHSNSDILQQNVSTSISANHSDADQGLMRVSPHASLTGISAIATSPLMSTLSNAALAFAKVRADYTAKSTDELNVEEEDIVRILPTASAGAEKPGMVYATLNDLAGWIPAASIRILSEEEAAAEGIVPGDSISDMSQGMGASNLTASNGQSFDAINAAGTGESLNHASASSIFSPTMGFGALSTGPMSQLNQNAQTRSWYAKYKSMPRYEKRAFSNSFSVAIGEASGNEAPNAVTSPDVASATVLSASTQPQATTSSATGLPQRNRSPSSSSIVSMSAVLSPGDQADTPNPSLGHKSDKGWGSSFIWGGATSARQQTPSAPTAAPNTVNKVAILGAPAGQRQLWVDFIGGQEAAERLGLSKKEIKRQEVIYEIITTESDYIDDLDTVCEVYIKQIKRNKLIRPKDMAIIFSNIEQLLPVNMELLRSLVKRQPENNHVVEQVGDVFIRVSDYLKIYTMYCSNHPYALIKLQTVRQNKTVAKFLDQCATLPECRNLNLPNFMLKPVQRVCKYPLFLRELIKATEPDHPDSENLLKALLKIETVVTIINEGARQTENVHKMLELQSRFLARVNIVAPSRIMVRSGGIDVRNTQNETKRREVYLFNDMIIVSKPEGDKYKLINMVPFDMIFVNSFYDSSEEHQIEIVHVNNARFYFVFASEAEKDAWIGAIRGAVEEWMEQKQRMNVVQSPVKPRQLSDSNTPLSVSTSNGATTNKNKSGAPSPATQIPSAVKNSGIRSSASPRALRHIETASEETDNTLPGKTDSTTASTQSLSRRQNNNTSADSTSMDESDSFEVTSSTNELYTSTKQTLAFQSKVQSGMGSSGNLSSTMLSRRHTSREKIHSEDVGASGANKRVPPPVLEHKPRQQRVLSFAQEANESVREEESASSPTRRPPIFTLSPIALQHQKLKLQNPAGSAPPPLPPSRAKNMIVQDKHESESAASVAMNTGSRTDLSDNKNAAAHGRSATTEPIATGKKPDSSWRSSPSDKSNASTSGSSGPVPSGKPGNNNAKSKSQSDLQSQQRSRSATEGPLSLESRDRLDEKGQKSSKESVSNKLETSQQRSTNDLQRGGCSEVSLGGGSNSGNPLTESPPASRSTHGYSSSHAASSSYSVGRSNTSINKPVRQARIVDVQRGPGTTIKAFSYIISVVYVGNSDSKARVLNRTFDDFFDLHLQLVGHFPEAAGISTGAEIIRSTPVGASTIASVEAQPPIKRILPELPGQMMFVSESVARSRISQLQAYIDTLISLPPKISRSPVVLKFFRPS